MNTSTIKIFEKKIIAIMGIFFLTVFLTGSAHAQQEKKTGFSVELDMFSGYVNPSYLISDSADVSLISEYIAMFSDSTKCSYLAKNEEIQYPHVTGYRGIVVTVIGRIPQVPEHFVIYKGTIMVVKGNEFLLPPQSAESAKKIEKKVFYYDDADSKLEKLFLRILPRYMDQKVTTMDNQKNRPNIPTQKILELIPKELLE
jgi:hypothetical protein